MSSSETSENEGRRVAEAYASLVADFVEWASRQGDVRAAIILGSRARADHPADEFADLDIAMVADAPEKYIDDSFWPEEIGTVILTFTEPTATGEDVERRVLFEGGLDVDFALIPTEKVDAFAHIPAVSPAGAQLAQVFRRGTRILFDKMGMAKHIEKFSSSSHGSSFRPPSPQEFMQVVSDFLYHTLWTAKHLRRGEVWWAKGGCDDHLKYLLRRMLEWHAQSRGVRDTWFRGRFFEEWADPRALQELESAFARYDSEDVWRALIATMDLFGWVARETAHNVSLSYPEATEEKVRALVDALYEKRNRPS